MRQHDEQHSHSSSSVTAAAVPIAAAMASSAVQNAATILAVNAATATAAASLATMIPTKEHQPQQRARSMSDASSELSSVLSDTAGSEDDDDDNTGSGGAAGNKRRRKNRSTPPTSLDEPRAGAGGHTPRKRTYVKRANRAAAAWQAEEEVKDRKEYLHQGLYAPSLNRGVTAREQRKGVMIKQLQPKRLSAKEKAKISDNFKFKLPLHHGATLLEQRRDFRLPWDILQDFDLSRLPDSVEGVAYRSDALDRVGRSKNPTHYREIHQSRCPTLFPGVLTFAPRDSKDEAAENSRQPPQGRNTYSN